VEQLLLLARQEAGPASEQKKDRLDLAELARATVADLAASAHERKIDLGLAQADAAWINGQQDALRILLRNLMDNALKYTPKGGKVDVQVKMEADRACLQIEDSGPGIPEADRSRVFDRFYRIQGATANGSGLGLAIVKTIADNHQADIFLQQSPALGGLKAVIRFPSVKTA
jgi:two-component system OmpR family sensor kinase